MITYLLKRLLSVIPVMGVVAVLVFSLLYLAPGDPAALLAGETASESEIAEMSRKLGLDQPFLPRFASWLWAVLHGDLGNSIYSGVLPSCLTPAYRLSRRHEIAEHFPSFEGVSFSA